MSQYTNQMQFCYLGQQQICLCFTQLASSYAALGRSVSVFEN